MLERVSSICTRLLLTTTPRECTAPVLSSRFVCAPAKGIIDGFGETLVHSFARSVGRRVHACQEAEISIFIALHNCLASFRCGRRGKNPNLLPPPESGPSERARAHTQKQHHHLESESISILFARSFFAVHTDQSLLWGPVKSRRSKR